MAGLCSSLLFTLFLSSRGGDDASLKSLYDGHRWFELRDLLEKNHAPAFYQGAVACAFNDLRGCEEKLRTVFNSAPRSNELVEAHRILASAYFTHGEYKQALAQVDAILARRPHDSDSLSSRPVIAILAEFPDQELEGRASAVDLRRWRIAVLHQRHPGDVLV